MIYRYKGVRATQASGHDVFSFAATPVEILEFSEIERVSRNENGHLKGFQRHQVATHIKEIKDYLIREDAILPNAIIIAFLDNVKITDLGDSVIEIEIDAGASKPGFVVDGQQRLSALAGIDKPGFQVFVSALICKDYNELRQQFVLINNTRPLPKTLIYELLPTVEGLPQRFTSRKFAAQIVDLLNFLPNSAIFGEIRQHTNPAGVISDIAMQKLVMNSASDGAVRSFMKYEDFEGRSISLINEFFKAVVAVFRPEWEGMTPRTSRLKHGAGIIALGYVMEQLYSSTGAITKDEFVKGLLLIKPYTAWTSGEWIISEDDRRPWNGIQNTPNDIGLLSRFLVQTLKKEMRT
jgi:DGQHR domain-containing protein